MKNRWYQHSCSTVRQNLRRERDSAAIFQIRSPMRIFKRSFILFRFVCLSTRELRCFDEDDPTDVFEYLVESELAS